MQASSSKKLKLEVVKQDEELTSPKSLSKINDNAESYKTTFTCFAQYDDDSDHDDDTDEINSYVEEFLAKQAKRDIMLQKFKKNLDQSYPAYKVYRKGTKYQYKTVQYGLFDPVYILEPFTDAIRQPKGCLFQMLFHLVSDFDVVSRTAYQV